MQSFLTYFFIAIGIGILGAVAEVMNHRKLKALTDREIVVLRYPAVVRYVFIVLALVMAVILVSLILEDAAGQVGEIIVFSALLLMCVVTYACLSRWRIVVEQSADHVQVTPYLGRTYSVRYGDITQCRVKGGSVKFWAGQRKISIDGSTTYLPVFKAALRERGIKVEEQ